MSHRRSSLVALLLTVSLTGITSVAAAHGALPPGVGKPIGKPAVVPVLPIASKFKDIALPPTLQSKLPQGKALDKQLGALGAWNLGTAAPSKNFRPILDAGDLTGKRILVVLQENTGSLAILPEGVPADVRAAIETVVDHSAETFEDMKSTLQGAGRYDRVELLTDAACTRERLLGALVDYTKRNATIDLVVLGHGSDDALSIHGDEWLLGSPGYDASDARHIRRLQDEARARGVDHLNLRMVFLCNCRGSTTSDDWMAIGAKVVVASQGDNYMPEPMTSYFLHDWLAGETAGQSANMAYQYSVPFYTLVFPPVATASFRTETVSAPCGESWVDNGCSARNPVTGRSYSFGCYKVQYCQVSIDVPVGVDLQTHPHIASSKLVVAGDTNLRFGQM